MEMPCGREGSEGAALRLGSRSRIEVGAPRHVVISTVAKQSGEISLLYCGWQLVAGGWENHTTALAGDGKQANRVCCAWKYTPIPAYGGTSPQESMSLDFRVALLPYSTAITDSLDSQVATAPLRIQFAGVTPVPLPPYAGGRINRYMLPHRDMWHNA